MFIKRVAEKRRQRLLTAALNHFVRQSEQTQIGSLLEFLKERLGRKGNYL